MLRGAIRTGCLVVVLGTARPAPADVTGPYEGQLSGPRLAQAAPASGVLTQSGRVLAGTLVITAPASTIDGAYVVTGTAAGRSVRVVGTNPSGVRLVWRGAVTANGVAGRLRLRGPHVRLKGRLHLDRQTASGDGSGCDSVFTQNETFFTSQVMDQVLLATCAACHVSGGQAASTRLHVVRGDPLATARSVAVLVDTANPAGSLLLQKPIAAVPHGGGQQLKPGGTEEQILAQWAGMVAASGCVAGSSAAPTSLFVQDCGGCHGANGAGNGNAPDVRCAVNSVLADATRRGRGPAMPAFALSQHDLATLAAYLHVRCSGQPKELYAGNCAGCHGPTGGGGIRGDGASGPNIRCSEAGDFAEAVRAGSEGMPAFAELTGAQVGALERYVSGFCAGGGGD